MDGGQMRLPEAGTIITSDLPGVMSIISLHFADRGLTDATIEAACIYSTADKIELASILDTKRCPFKSAALVIPYTNLQGQNGYARVRPDKPRFSKKKPVKYETPSGGEIKSISRPAWPRCWPTSDRRPLSPRANSRPWHRRSMVSPASVWWECTAGQCSTTRPFCPRWSTSAGMAARPTSLTTATSPISPTCRTQRPDSPPT